MEGLDLKKKNSLSCWGQFISRMKVAEAKDWLMMSDLSGSLQLQKNYFATVSLKVTEIAVKEAADSTVIVAVEEQD